MNEENGNKEAEAVEEQVQVEPAQAESVPVTDETDPQEQPAPDAVEAEPQAEEPAPEPVEAEPQAEEPAPEPDEEEPQAEEPALESAEEEPQAEEPALESAESEPVSVDQVPDSEKPDMCWCVLRVASNREEHVCNALRKKVQIEGLEDRIGRILVPTEKHRVGRGYPGTGKKVVDKKLYPGYVFIEIILEEDGSVSEDAWFTIKETAGVGDFIGATGRPIPMSKDDVDKMLQQVEKAEDGEPISVEFRKGDQVKIKEGAFENFEGVVDEILPDKGLVRVVTTIFGRSTPVELEYWQIEKP
jgi:transcriptional antiterminator NusG